MRLLGQMVDSNLVSPKEYQIYFSKFLIEAKQELKKQAITEKNRAIKKAEKEKEKKNNNSYNSDDDSKDAGNEDLSLYATLLLPYTETNASVRPLIQQMLGSNDKQLKYNTLILLLRNRKPVPDTLLKYFAALEEYRYKLYSDLKRNKEMDKFPQQYNNHLDLGRSKLMKEKSYDKADSLVYIDRLPANIKGKKGFVYFYKYKNKKDDMNWKLATVGLVPEDPKVFEFDNAGETGSGEYDSPLTYQGNDYYKYDFTGFSETKIKDDESLSDQLHKMLKRFLYSKRKSAREFYERDGHRDFDVTRLEVGD